MLGSVGGGAQDMVLDVFHNLDDHATSTIERGQFMQASPTTTSTSLVSMCESLDTMNHPLSLLSIAVTALDCARVPHPSWLPHACSNVCCCTAAA